ncbi:CBN-UNC-39 protein [Caenorhabditis brenneri]|uniref:CBN-UNC-39 protein n=1 Tax=Caenorhabditis brenneri TaxID=135651 RepID=G0NM92_CAEBE|nr:CBN-UNC-39 protein [Caenorhabditis brenneri]
MNHLSPPPSQQYFMPDPHHLLDTSSYFDCYHPHPQQHHLQYPIPTVSTSSTEVSTSSLLPTLSSHFTSSSGAPPYEHLSPSSSSSHILITPPSVIPSLSPISSPTLSTFGFQMADYSIEQMEAIATSLFQARDGERLVSFFNQLKAIYGATALNQIVSEPILVAYTYALYHSNDFEQLFNLLATHSFQHIYFNDLQDIWHHARYRESQLKRGKELNPVEKYRLRRKFPPPKTIWDGEETVYSFKDSSRKYLKKFFQEITQYPSQEQKREISKHTGLKIVQISNWFKNRRQRDKTDNADRSPPSSSSSTNGSNNEFPPLAMNTQNINFVGVPFNVQHMNMFFDPN